MITLQQITIRRAQKLLLEDVNLTLYAKQKIGLIGANGCGKSSFFAMIRGELEPHRGNINLPTNIHITEVKQEIPTSSRSAIDYVIDGDEEYRSLLAKIVQAESEEDATTLACCHDQLANIDGYAITGKVEKILKGLGFKAEELSYPTTHFSGGWRMRLNLAQALISRSDLMLLDEPTNHLDLDAIIWLEKWLQDFPGTLLIISHDREFLDNTVEHILHFENLKLKLYRGNYSQFERLYNEQLLLQQATYEKQQTQITHMQSFINRFKAKASKARQAQSRVKALEKMELVAAVIHQDAFRFEFKKPKECPNPLLRIEQATVGYEREHPILSNINIQLAPYERLGLLGVNGAGKSTFMKTIAGMLEPFSGLVHFYKGIKIGYFAQHQIEHLDLSCSPLELLQEIAPHQREQELRNFLGSFQFSGDMATSAIDTFSGGEKARVALALIVWQAPNLLLLDEPTNHLDMKMREALILALQEYQGALVLVSHDRHLVRTTTDELMLVAHHHIDRFKGDLDDYRKFLLQRKNEKEAVVKINTKNNPSKEKRKLETQLQQLERKLNERQQKIKNLERLLSDSTLYDTHTPETIKSYHQEQKQLQHEIDYLESDWLLLFEQLAAM